MIPTFPIYSAQYGGGIGGLFGNLLKRGLTSIGKKAFETGLSALDQHSKGVPIKQALKSAAKQQLTSTIFGNSNNGGRGSKTKMAIKPGVKRKKNSLTKTFQMQTTGKKKRKASKSKEKKPIVL